MKREKLLMWLWFKLPESTRQKCTLWELGSLCSTEVLRSREVPLITTGEYMEAMKERSAA